MNNILYILISISLLFPGEKITKTFHENGMLQYIKYSNDRDTTILIKTVKIDQNGFITEFVKYSNGEISSKRIRKFIHNKNSTSIYDSSVVFQNTYFSKNKMTEKCIFKIDFSDKIDIQDIGLYKKINYLNEFGFIKQKRHHPSFNSLLALDEDLDKNISLSFSIDYLKYSNRFSFPISSYSNFGTINIGSLPRDEKGNYKFVSFYNDLIPNTIKNNYKKFNEYKGGVIEKGSFKKNIGSFNFSSSNKIDLWTYYSKNEIKEKEELFILDKEWEKSETWKKSGKPSKIKWSTSYDKNGDIKEKSNYKYNNDGEEIGKKSYFDDGKTVKQSYDENSGGDTTYYKNGNYKQIKKTLPNRNIQFQYYENGQLQLQAFWKEKHKDSLWVSYYKNGQIKYKNKYLNNQIDGPKIEYYESGKLKAEINYKNGKRDGYEIKYYENGQIKAEINYKNGEKYGYENEYYENGQIKTEASYQNSLFDMSLKKYYKNGQLKNTMNYKENKPYGVWLSLSKTGDTLSYSNYNKNGLNGVYKEFYNNGNPKYIKFYINGIQNGEYLYYGSNGKLKRKGKIKNNVEEGPWFRYFENGNIERKVTMKDGKPIVGTDVFYFENGNISSMDTLLSKNIIQYITYFPTGNKKLINFYELKKVPQYNHCGDPPCSRSGKFQTERLKFGLSEEFYNNGKLKLSQNFIIKDYNSISIGKKIWFYESGDTAGICNFKISSSDDNFSEGISNLDGNYIEFYENGNIKNYTFYIHGRIEGEKRKYDKSGNLIELTNYKNNQRHGLFIYDNKSKLTLINPGGVTENRYGTLDIHPDSISYLIPDPNTEDWKFYNFKTGNYLNGKLDGKFISIKRGDKEEGVYEYGRKEGEWITSNQDNIITKKNFYKNDQKFGKQILYYWDGAIREEINYLEGYDHKDGPYIKYYNDGTIEKKGQYKGSRKSNLWVEYSNTGTIKKESFHNIKNHNDFPDSVIFYNKNGKIIERGYLVTKERTTFIQYDSKK